MDTATPLTEMTPVEIDTALADIYAKVDKVQVALDRVNSRITRIDEVEPGSYYSMLPENSPAARAKLAAEADQHTIEIARIIRDEAHPLEQEFHLRPWTRYYLVDNTNGHVHKDTHCTTCFATTRYAWLVEQSGMSAEKLVDMAGEKACTVCFPWAPVDTLRQKTRLESPERKAARLERERAKAEREAKKAAKAIANPDGTPLKVFNFRVGDRVVRGKLIPAHDTFETIETIHAARGWLTDCYDGWRNPERPEDIQRVAEAIAHKEGKTPEQVNEEAKARAKRRR